MKKIWELSTMVHDIKDKVLEGLLKDIRRVEFIRRIKIFDLPSYLKKALEHLLRVTAQRFKASSVVLSVLDLTTEVIISSSGEIPGPCSLCNKLVKDNSILTISEDQDVRSALACGIPFQIKNETVGALYLIRQQSSEPVDFNLLTSVGATISSLFDDYCATHHELDTSLAELVVGTMYRLKLPLDNLMSHRASLRDFLVLQLSSQMTAQAIEERVNWSMEIFHKSMSYFQDEVERAIRVASHFLPAAGTASYQSSKLLRGGDILSNLRSVRPSERSGLHLICEPTPAFAATTMAVHLPALRSAFDVTCALRRQFYYPETIRIKLELKRLQEEEMNTRHKIQAGDQIPGILVMTIHATPGCSHPSSHHIAKRKVKSIDNCIIEHCSNVLIREILTAAKGSLTTTIALNRGSIISLSLPCSYIATSAWLLTQRSRVELPWRVANDTSIPSADLAISLRKSLSISKSPSCDTCEDTTRQSKELRSGLALLPPSQTELRSRRRRRDLNVRFAYKIATRVRALLNDLSCLSSNSIVPQ